MTGELFAGVLGGLESDFKGASKLIRKAYRYKEIKFDCFFIIGNMFKKGDNEKCIDKLLKGGYKFPIPTYFILGDRALPERVLNALKENDNILTENLEFLGNSGKLTLENGLKIVYFSGCPKENIDDSILEPHQYNVSEIQKMIDTTESNSIDILFTHHWPDGSGSLNQYWSYIKPPPERKNYLNKLIQHIRPKFYFASKLSNSRVILDPYIIQIDSNMSSVTNFVNIPTSINHHHQEWKFLFKIDPDSPNEHLTDSLHLKRDQDHSPSCDDISPTAKRNLDIAEEGNSKAGSHFFANPDAPKHKTIKEGYICKICNSKEHFVWKCPQKPEYNPFYSTEDCCFCMANEKCASHLTVSSGEEVYLAMARGSLNDPKSPSSKIPGGGQLLIMPTTHISTVGSFETQPESKGFKELTSYKKVITEFYAAYDCFPVYFETYRPSVNQHGLLQVYPVPNEFKKTIHKSMFDAFIDKMISPKRKFKFTLESPFIRVEYLEFSLSASFGPKTIIPLFLARRVLGSLLNCEDRIDWRKCEELTIEEETQFNKDFTTAFSKFNPLV